MKEKAADKILGTDVCVKFASNGKRKTLEPLI